MGPTKNCISSALQALCFYLFSLLHIFSPLHLAVSLSSLLLALSLSSQFEGGRNKPVRLSLLLCSTTNSFPPLLCKVFSFSPIFHRSLSLSLCLIFFLSVLFRTHQSYFLFFIYFFVVFFTSQVFFLAGSYMVMWV